MNTGNDTKGPVKEIRDKQVVNAYKAGFKFAIHYLLAWTQRSNTDPFDKTHFRDFLGKYTAGVEDDYFDNNPYPILNGPYTGKCPLPDGTCVECMSGLVEFPTKPDLGESDSKK